MPFSRRKRVVTEMVRPPRVNLVGIVLGPRTAAESAVAVLNLRTREYQVLMEDELVPKPEAATADWDAALLDYLWRCDPERVGIDGPCTLPAALLGRLPAEGTPDYLARACDGEVGRAAALVGAGAAVTARAIYLRHRCAARHIAVDEVSARAALLAFGVEKPWLRGKRGYQKNGAVLQRVIRTLSLDGTFTCVRGKLDTAAKVDALACVLSIAAPPEDTRWIGDPTEGQVRVPHRRYWQ
jgi:hypothetical protein